MNHSVLIMIFFFFCRSSQQWKLIPSITGEYFSAPDDIIIEEHSSATINVVYRPITMTKPKKHHTVMKLIFLKLKTISCLLICC